MCAKQMRTKQAAKALFTILALLLIVLNKNEAYFVFEDVAHVFAVKQNRLLSAFDVQHGFQCFV